MRCRSPITYRPRAATADVFPSLHVDRSLSNRSTLSFGASRRIVRPDPSYLNGYVDYEYPPNLTAGNPNLKPQFTQSYELGYGYESAAASYGLTGYYRRNTNSVTDVTEYLGNGLTLTSKANLPRSDSAGFEFAATGHLLPKLLYSLSGNAFYTQIDATALGTPGLKSTTGINVKAKLDYRPTADDSAQIIFTRTDKRLTPQGSVSAINIVNLGYKHMLTHALSAVATVSLAAPIERRPLPRFVCRGDRLGSFQWPALSALCIHADADGGL